ncbi:MAG: helix-turn-helix transcriptional regulator [Lachnospiraceae bacterium]|nr:helix-turn-helix transcriptional regulator [Lachnospiraceae bacterium]
MERGNLVFMLESILKERGISKNQICKVLEIPRSNLNRYCRNEFQRIDAGLVCKLCEYLEIDVGDLIKYEKAEKPNS